jgi:hypothetical protein
MAGDRLTTHLALLRNDLEQWGLPLVPRLLQVRLSQAASDSDWSVCLQNLSRLLYGLRLSQLCFNCSDVASTQTQQKTVSFAAAILHSHAIAKADRTGNIANNCSYADVAFRVQFLPHCLLCRNIVTVVSSG